MNTDLELDVTIRSKIRAPAVNFATSTRAARKCRPAARVAGSGYSRPKTKREKPISRQPIGSSTLRSNQLCTKAHSVNYLK